MGPTRSVAWERAMKIQDVILRAMAKRITWWQAAKIIGISERQMRRWHRRYEKFSYDGLWDRRRGGPSPRRVPLQTAQQVLRLDGEKYFDFNVSHFHEKLQEEYGIPLSYSWVKQALPASHQPVGRPATAGGLSEHWHVLLTEISIWVPGYVAAGVQLL